MSNDLTHPLKSIIKDLLKKIMYPYTTYEDYEKYGDMFIKGFKIEDETND